MRAAQTRIGQDPPTESDIQERLAEGLNVLGAIQTASGRPADPATLRRAVAIGKRVRFASSEPLCGPLAGCHALLGTCTGSLLKKRSVSGCRKLRPVSLTLTDSKQWFAICITQTTISGGTDVLGVLHGPPLFNDESWMFHWQLSLRQSGCWRA